MGSSAKASDSAIMPGDKRLATVAEQGETSRPRFRIAWGTEGAVDEEGKGESSSQLESSGVVACGGGSADARALPGFDGDATDEGGKDEEASAGDRAAAEGDADGDSEPDKEDLGLDGVLATEIDGTTGRAVVAREAAGTSLPGALAKTDFTSSGD